MGQAARQCPALNGHPADELRSIAGFLWYAEVDPAIDITYPPAVNLALANTTLSADNHHNSQTDLSPGSP
jgi:hypothetical protein